MKRLLNSKEASKITGFSLAYIWRLARTGQLKSVRTTPTGSFRFKEVDLMSLTHAPEQFPPDKDPKKKEG